MILRGMAFTCMLPFNLNPRGSLKSRKDLTVYESSYSESLSYLDMDPFDVYNRNEMSGWLAIGGLCLSIIFSIACLCCGIYINFYRHTINEVVLSPAWRNAPFDAVPAVFTGIIAILPTTSSTKTEFLSLALNLIVTICTESIGFVHSVALKSALAGESRLHCNTNLRLLTAAHGNGWRNPNGSLFNAIMTILLITSYVASSLIFIPFHAEVTDDASQQWWNTCIPAVPVLVLGIALLLQAVIALAGLRQTKILTWSSSPLDTTAALLHEGLFTRNEGRCMHNVTDLNSYVGPRPPSELQPSAWESHSSIKKIIILLWSLVLMCVIWGGMVIVAWTQWVTSALGPGLDSWSLFPNSHTNLVEYETYVDPDYGYPEAVWFIVFMVFIAVQGGMTLGLHCSEIIVNVTRDEVIWRNATSSTGTHSSQNPLITMLGSWPNVGLLVAKPVLRE